MTSPQNIEKFIQTLITQHGREFAAFVMRLTRMPAHAPTFSRVFNVFYRRVYPGYRSKPISSKFATAIKHLSKRQEDFTSYVKKHWV